MKIAPVSQIQSTEWTGLSLERGILSHRFLRLRCGDCGHDKLIAFSCERRGSCPLCGARRMVLTAAHVPVRQWVLRLPASGCVPYRGVSLVQVPS